MENKKYTLEILSNKLSKEDIFSKLKELMKGELVEAKNPNIKFKEDGVLIADEYGELFQLKNLNHDCLKENNIAICFISPSRGIIEFKLPKDKNEEYPFNDLLEFFKWSYEYVDMTSNDVIKYNDKPGINPRCKESTKLKQKYNLKSHEDIFNKIIEYLKEETDMVMCFYWPE